jgi:hypothetical protein
MILKTLDNLYRSVAMIFFFYKQKKCVEKKNNKIEYFQCYDPNRARKSTTRDAKTFVALAILTTSGA